MLCKMSPPITFVGSSQAALHLSCFAVLLGFLSHATALPASGHMLVYSAFTMHNAAAPSCSAMRPCLHATLASKAHSGIFDHWILQAMTCGLVTFGTNR